MMQMFHERVYKSSQNDKTCEGEKNLDANSVGFYRVASLFAILLLGATLSQHDWRLQSKNACLDISRLTDKAETEDI